MLVGRYRGVLVGGLVVLFLALLAVLGRAPLALAMPQADVSAAGIITVTTTTDGMSTSDPCTLRKVLRHLNGCSNSGDRIVLSPATYVLTDTNAGALVVLSGENMIITVAGEGYAIIQGMAGWDYGILTINATSVVTISNVTIRDGNATSGSLPHKAFGGGIYNAGTLSLVNCQILSNTAILAGGGILNIGTLLLTDSLVMSNTVSGDAAQGGGIYNNKNLIVSNSAIVSNTIAKGQGGGVFVDTGNSSTFLKNVTLSGNLAAEGGGLFFGNQTSGELSYVTVYRNTATAATTSGGGIAAPTAISIIITSTILAGNVGPVNNDCNGSLVSSGYNLIQSNCGVITKTGDLTGLDPLLGPLQDNGGPTFTHELTETSPALNRIPRNTNGCGVSISTDQRGNGRPQGDGCDIGAFELGNGANATIYLPVILR